MRLFSEQLKGWVSPTNAFIALYANVENTFWLDREHAVGNRFSVIGTGERVKFDTVAGLSEYLEVCEDLELPFEFRPGLVGWLDFELNSPQMLRVESALVFDHENRHLYLIARAENELRFKNWLDAALLRIGLIGGESLKYLAAAATPNISSVVPRHNDSEYLELIATAQENIRAGEVYQLCLTNEYLITGSADPLATFVQLRDANPAPYAAYVRVGERKLVCSSPEQFLRVSSSGEVSTKPIKGTRPRSTDLVEDLKIIDELAANLKERAENLMIVDLMRNDLLKVCEQDSIRVEKLFDVESYATVHQLVSTVQGQLRASTSAAEALAACFPGGSMTGAPKLRAISLIGDLEQGARGIYSGVVGYLGDNGSADFGMVIRSLVFEGSKITLGVGGGITIDSDPEAELDETKLKAKALLRALKANAGPA